MYGNEGGVSLFYKIGTLLSIKGTRGKVIGYIKYANRRDKDKTWIEYRIMTDTGECWLSQDDIYHEYSISWPYNSVFGNIGPEWHEVDRGEEYVVSKGGDVDVDYGETALFVEYEDATEEQILSAEVWSDGTEYSRGEYVDADQIAVMGFEKPKNPYKAAKALTIFMIFCFIITFISGFATEIFSGQLFGSRISKYLKKSPMFTYSTSITGNSKQKADVYEYYINATTDEVAKLIIGEIDGNTECVTQKDDTADEDIAIVTKNEYCLIYHPEDNPSSVLIQISKRKYCYSSDASPYRSSKASSRWYRSHYYSSSYVSDSSRYKKTPSAYKTYSGETVHNIGNGYFDSYSNSIRQNSINSRRSSGGGISSGK